MPAHPTPQELAIFLKGNGHAEPALGRRVVRHLLTGCPICRQKMSTLREQSDLVFKPEATADVESHAEGRQNQSEYNYDRAFTRAENVLSLFLSEGRPRPDPPGAILAELFPGPLDGAPSASENRFAIPALIKWLTKRSHGVRYADPKEMLHWGLMARLAADSCSSEVAGSSYRLADLRAQAWGQFGTSLRVSGRLSEAEEALATGERYREAGTGDPMIRARLNEQIAALCIFQRRFADAIEMDEGATRIYRELGDRHRFARASVQEAVMFLYSGDADQAARNLRLAIPLIDSKADPHLTLAARHNLVRCYVDLNRPDLAKSLYSQSRELYQGLRDDLILLRATWQEGQLLRGLGHLRAAKVALLQARSGFLDRGLAFEVAEVTRDLIAVLQQMGEQQMLEEIVLETSDRVEQMHPSAEALASLKEIQHSKYSS